jgi:LmbE family N-acetylglucosaminyl deacetylase
VPAVLLDPPPPEHVLVIAAHPDDLEFSCGGTVARWTSEGARATLCLCTKGEKGTQNRDVEPDELARVRVEEQDEAARILGIGEVVFLDREDGMVVADVDLRRDLVRVIRRVRPDALIAPDPTFRFDPAYIDHPDHAATGEAALQAVYPTARDRAAEPELLAEGLEPHVVTRIFLATPREANCAVDVGAQLATKIAALSAHRSQIDEASARAVVTSSAAAAGEAFGLEHAESFYAISLETTGSPAPSATAPSTTPSRSST